MPRIEKLIVTNLSALKHKYEDRLPRVIAAVNGLIGADRGRSITSALVGLDVPATMRRYRAPVVTDASDCRQNKNAIDALYRRLKPDYIVILGAIDVVPHQDLRNPLFHVDDDEDEFAYGDLPYACEQPYSRDIHRFRSPTRVVGRVPDVTGKGDAAYLVALLRTAARYRQRSRDDYEQPFGLTALSWKDSTALSLRNLFGADTDLNTSPPKGPRWPTSLLRRRAHFINCHGDTADTFFYGEHPVTERKPPAHSARYLEHARRVQEGTVVAAECCYGAELFDPKETRGQLGICNTYLRHGAYGFFGSSTTAYGPPSGNGEADLICQYFLERVLRGASLGRATLEARQRYVQAAAVLGPTGLKTLAQFSLMGDPSVHPVGRAPHGLAKSRVYTRVVADPKAKAAERAQRREWVVRYASAIGDATAATRHQTRPTAGRAVRTVLERAAREAGVRTVRITSHAVVDPAARRIRSELGTSAGRKTVHIATGKTGRARTFGARRVRAIVAVVATVENGRVVSVYRLVSK